MKFMKKRSARYTALIFAALIIFAVVIAVFQPSCQGALSIDDIPPFSGDAYISINNNIPEFTQSDYTVESYEYYSPLDWLGRCGYVMACVGYDLMPTEDRGSIGQVKPSGWQTVKYDFIDGKYLYNRCHLIGYQLSGENANEENLITGTRFLNIEGMLPFENMIADYVKETKNHVLYRVTPIFDGNDLVARGVQMEGWSVEDNGEGICFHVYAYNNQPGVQINYADGTSNLIESGGQTSDPSKENRTFILNKNSKKFHLTSCTLGDDIKTENKEHFTGQREELINDGYQPCKSCNP